MANVHLTIVVDESGSMQERRAGVVEGVNKFVSELKAVDGDPTYVTLITFDDTYNRPKVRTLSDGVPLEGFAGLTEYRPHGSTPLNDALMAALRATRAHMEEGDRALVTVVTDGFENASETTTDKVREAVRECESEGWQFIYLGANVDSFSEAGGLGMANAKSANFSGSVRSTSNAFATSGKLASTYRRAGGQSLYATAAAAAPDSIAEDDTELQAHFADIDEAVRKAQRSR